MTTPAGHRRRSLIAIETSGGEIECDRVSRRANLVEGVGVYLLVQAAWWVCFGSLSRSPGHEWLRVLGVSLIAAAALYALMVAPWLHGDGWHALGFARPMELVAFCRTHAPGGRRLPLVVLVTVAAFVGLLLLANWDYLLIRLSVRLASPDTYLALTASPWRGVAMGAAAVALTAVFAIFGIRWDNLPSALRAVGGLTVAFAASIEIAAVARATLTGDWTTFAGLAWAGSTRNGVLVHLAFYTLWAPLQQWFMLGYFNTRIRKGIAASGRGPASGRVLAAGLTGLAFGALHIPAWPLVAVTFAGGCAYGWLFQRDRNRNLFVLGLAHGLVGTLLATTTSIRMVVGP